MTHGVQIAFDALWSCLTLVPCPSCDGPLCEATTPEKDWIPLGRGPEVQSFGRGCFLICPHCFEYVPVEAAATETGLGFRVARP